MMLIICIHDRKYNPNINGDITTLLGLNYRSLKQICTGPSSLSEQSLTVFQLNSLFII